MCCFVAGIMLVEIVWLVLGVMWLVYHYHDCPVEGAKEAILGKEQHYSFHVQMCSVLQNWIKTIIRLRGDHEYFAPKLCWFDTQ
jgi:hypothetical protein